MDQGFKTLEGLQYFGGPMMKENEGAGPRRFMAQGCFFASGACAAFLFGGVDLWVQGILGLLLGTACLLEASSNSPTAPRVSRPALFFVGSLLFLVAVSLCPWPAEWAGWLTPGQARSLSELEGVAPRWLHGSMAPQATWQALFKLLGAVSVLYLTWSWSADRGFRRRLHIFFTSLGVFVALLGVIDWLDGSDRIYGFYEATGKAHCGPFNNRNHFSNYVNICAIFSVGMFLRHCFPGKHRKGNFRYGLISLLAAVLCASTSIATGSRGGLLSLGAGLMTFGLLVVFRRKFGLQAKVVMIIALVGSAFLLAYGRGVLERIEGSDRNQVHLEEGRWKIWRETRVMSLGMKGQGIGVGAFKTVFPAYQTSLGDKTITHVENEYLQAWVEWGIAGSLIWTMIGIGIIRGAWRTLKTHARDWQMAGWSALVVMAVHAGVDFPLHISANAWLACALLGMCLSPRRESSDALSADGKPIKRQFHQKAGLILCGCLLLTGSFFAWIKSDDIFKQIEKNLAAGRFDAALRESQKAIRQWPFYWRAHVLTGYSAAGLPGMKREVRRHFRNAQRLAKSDPRISMQAGLLFIRRSPVIADEFFETVLALSSRPDLALREILERAFQNGVDVFEFEALALGKPEQWQVMWRFLLEHKLPKPVLDRWLAEGMEYWLDDPSLRVKIFPVIIENACERSILESFARHAPTTDHERYWMARAQECAGDYERATRAYVELWRARTNLVPHFASSIEINERALRLAVLNLDDPRLHRKVAETLAAQSRHADALYFWDRLLQDNPDDPLAKYGRALALREIGDWKRASAEWRYLVEKQLVDTKKP